MDPLTFDSPHTKTHLLLQAHFCHAPLPIADYLTDTKSVLDQALRILQVSVNTVLNTHALIKCPLSLFSRQCQDCVLVIVDVWLSSFLSWYV